MINWDDVLPLTIGLWPDILKTACGVQDSVFNGKHQACPSCGGKDRFRWTDNIDRMGDGGAICNQCGSSNGMGWLMRLSGMEFPEAVKTVSDYVNYIPVETREIKKKEIQSKSAAKSLSYVVDAREKALPMLKMAKPAPDDYVPTVFKRYGIMPSNLMMHAVGEHEFIINSVRNGAGRIINAMLICPDTGDYNHATSDGFSWTGRTVIGEDSGRFIYLCSGWIQGHILHRITRAQVWVCYDTCNINNVLLSEADRSRLRVFSDGLDRDTLTAASNYDLGVLMPDGDSLLQSLTVQKKVFNADVLLGELE